VIAAIHIFKLHVGSFNFSQLEYATNAVQYL